MLTFGLLAAAAHAQDSFTIQPEILIEANAAFGDGHLTNGAGAPTVFWDSFHSQYVMIYESRLPETDPNCTVGKWGLGVAFSDDGVDWDPRTTRLLNPLTNSFYECVVAQPTAFQVLTGYAVIYFKSEQGADACDVTTPSWGCNRFTGVGRMLMYFNADGSVKKTVVDTTPKLNIQVESGRPKVTYKVNKYYLMHERRPAIWTATASTIAVKFTGASETMTPGDVAWAPDEFFNPAVICEDAADFPLTTYPGGKLLDGEVPALISEANMGKAVSADGFSWLFNADPYFTWDDELQFRHWEVLRFIDNSGYLLYFSEKDPATGNPRIRIGTTTDTWSGSNIHAKRCFF
jgi:hypothetical protein